MSGLVSVVIPVYNGERFLGAAIDSALAQTHAPVEIVVVDDGSTDASAETAEGRGVRVLREPHRGIPAPFNAGIAAARGEYIAFLGADDLWPPERLAVEVAHLRAHPELGFVMAHAVQFLERGDALPPWLDDEWIAGVHAAGSAPARPPTAGMTVPVPHPATMLARAELFDRLGALDPAYDIGEDVEWLMRATDAGVRHALLPDVVLYHRLHATNTSHRLDAVLVTRVRLARESVARKRARAEPLVSVVVPVFNGERFLAEALESAGAQTHGNVEIVVVDDGSTDRSAEIAAEHGAELLRLPHRGVSAARNAGIAAARGELIALLDADDVWPADRLATLVARLRACPELGFVVGRARVFLEPGTPPPEWFDDRWEQGESIPGLGTLVARRELFDRVGGFDESLEVCEDLDWIARAKDLGVAHEAVDDVVLHYRVHGANTGLPRRDDLRAGVLATVRASVARKRPSLVSVVIPAYNAKRFLPEAIESVLAQDHEPVEVIVVDDGSTDGTAEVAGAYPVHVIRQANGGQAAARNAGVAASRGDLVAFLDADDLWFPGKLSRQIAHLSAHPELGYVVVRMQRFLMPGTPWPPGTPRDFFAGPQPGTLPSAALVRRSVLDAVGPFDPRFRHACDTDWQARAMEAGVRWELLEEVLVRYRLHGANCSYDNLGMKREMFALLRSSLERRRATA